jgi:threonine synthase
MGLPIERLIVATNVNDILARTLQTGRYEVRDVIASSSPAMDIQVSSNFERLLFDAYHRDAASVRAAMGSLAQSGSFEIAAGALAEIRARFVAGSADEEETIAAIRAVHQESNYILDPHTAVGLAVARKLKARDAMPTIMLGTAHPAKFPQAVAAAIGVRPELPARLADLGARRERIVTLPASSEAVARFIEGKSRAAVAGAAA